MPMVGPADELVVVFILFTASTKADALHCATHELFCSTRLGQSVPVTFTLSRVMLSMSATCVHRAVDVHALVMRFSMEFFTTVLDTEAVTPMVAHWGEGVGVWVLMAAQVQRAAWKGAGVKRFMGRAPPPRRWARFAVQGLALTRAPHKTRPPLKRARTPHGPSTTPHTPRNSTPVHAMSGNKRGKGNPRKGVYTADPEWAGRPSCQTCHTQEARVAAQSRLVHNPRNQDTLMNGVMFPSGVDAVTAPQQTLAQAQQYYTLGFLQGQRQGFAAAQEGAPAANGVVTHPNMDSVGRSAVSSVPLASDGGSFGNATGVFGGMRNAGMLAFADGAPLSSR